MYEVFREFEVMDGKTVLSMGEARYRFTVTPGRKAVTWANASEGFSPAEGPTVEILTVETLWGPNGSWREVKGDAFAMLTAEVPDAWFLEQAMEVAQ
jgi:hypothetical protein